MDLEARIERLERNERRWRLTAVGALAVLGVVVAAGALADQEKLSVRRLAIVDDHGTERITLEVAGGPADGDRGLAGDAKVGVSAIEGTALLVLKGKGGDSGSRAMLATGPDGSSALALFDDHGAMRLRAAVRPVGPDLLILGPDGKPAFQKP